MVGVRTTAGDAARAQLLGFIREFQAERGYIPSLKQMIDATGIQRASVAWHLTKLRESGVVGFEDGNMARSLRLL